MGSAFGRRIGRLLFRGSGRLLCHMRERVIERRRADAFIVDMCVNHGCIHAFMTKYRL